MSDAHYININAGKALLYLKAKDGKNLHIFVYELNLERSFPPLQRSDFRAIHKSIIFSYLTG